MKTRHRGSNRRINGVDTDMTALGATLYLGFFASAALWLFTTADSDVTGSDGAGYDITDQRPDFSNSDSTAAGPLGSSSWPVTHASSK